MRITYFADVLLPLPLPSLFTYRIPHELDKPVAFGMRVIVPFGRSKLYSALVVRVHDEVPKQVNTKYILDVIDSQPVVSEKQFKLWQWMADYYLCTLGEVMAAALPSALKLASETKILLHPDFNGDVSVLNENELHIAEALTYQESMTVDQIARTVNIQKMLPIIKSLVDKKVVVTDEELRNPYKAKKETVIRLADNYAEESAFMTLLDQLNSSQRTVSQADSLLAFIMDAKSEQGYDFAARVPRSKLFESGKITPSRLQTMLKKGYLVAEEVVRPAALLRVSGGVPLLVA